MDDLLKRVSNNILNKKVLEALIFSNALASLESNQKFLYENSTAYLEVDTAGGSDYGVVSLIGFCKWTNYHPD